MTSLLLEATGAYRAVVSRWGGLPHDWQHLCREQAKAWRTWIDAKLVNEPTTKQHPLHELIGILEENDLCQITSLYETDVKSPREERADPEVIRTCLLKLHCIADEAMKGIGTLYAPHSDPYERDGERIEVSPALHLAANSLLTLRGTLSRLGKHRGIVLPKSLAPQLGLTLRSLSQNLTFHQSEADVTWRAVPWMNVDENTLNMLLVPWPYVVTADAFRRDVRGPDVARVGHERYFRYAPPSGRPWPFDSSAPAASHAAAPDHDPHIVDAQRVHDSLSCFSPDDIVRRVLAARDDGNRVHLIVLPEAALRGSQLKDLLGTLESVLTASEMPIVVAGVCDESDEQPFNRVILSVYYAGRWYSIEQDKHHRWRLDPNQIATYQLGGVISGSKHWWESITIPRRRLSFLTSNSWLTLAPLICEDLARLDPVSDLIRGVGPTLLIAILLDGPQLASRWSARYAGIFADDPGTSVLTLTSLGFADRSEPLGMNRNQAAENRGIVAAWKDKLTPWRQLHIGRVERAGLLTVATRSRRQETADGRGIEDTPVFVFQGIRTPTVRVQHADTLRRRLTGADDRKKLAAILARERPDQQEAARWPRGSWQAAILERATGSRDVERARRVRDAAAAASDDGKRGRGERDTKASDARPDQPFVDACELSLFTFYVDAILEASAPVRRTLERWLLLSLGVPVSGHDPEAWKCESSPSRDLAAEISHLIRGAIRYRDYIPPVIPTPHLIFALKRVTDIVNEGHENADGTRDRSGEFQKDPRTHLLRSLAASARAELTARMTEMGTFSVLSDAVMQERERAVETSSHAHLHWTDDERRVRSHRFPVRHVGRILLSAPSTIMWAVHNRLSIARRTGAMKTGEADLLAYIESTLVDGDPARGEDGRENHFSYLTWRTIVQGVEKRSPVDVSGLDPNGEPESEPGTRNLEPGAVR